MERTKDECYALLDRLTDCGAAYKLARPSDFIRWCAGPAIDAAITQADENDDFEQMHMIARALTSAAESLLARIDAPSGWSAAALRERGRK